MTSSSLSSSPPPPPPSSINGQEQQREEKGAIVKSCGRGGDRKSVKTRITSRARPRAEISAVAHGHCGDDHKRPSRLPDIHATRTSNVTLSSADCAFKLTCAATSRRAAGINHCLLSHTCSNLDLCLRFPILPLDEAFNFCPMTVIVPSVRQTLSSLAFRSLQFAPSIRILYVSRSSLRSFPPLEYFRKKKTLAPRT